MLQIDSGLVFLLRELEVMQYLHRRVVGEIDSHGFYSDPSIFRGAHAAERQAEINKEMGADARVGNAAEENWVGGGGAREGAKMFQMRRSETQ